MNRIPEKLTAEEKALTKRALASVERLLYRREMGLPVKPLQVGEMFTTDPVPEPWEERRRKYLSNHGF